MTLISIRQPGYLPYLGFFKKIQVSDIFVEFDDVPYTRSDWDNRNQIRTFDGTVRLTIPVYNKLGQRLKDVMIVNTENWSKKHKIAIKNNYQKAPYFSKYWDLIESILEKNHEKLIDLNLSLIDYFCSELSINTKIIKSSELNIDLKGSERLLEICKKLNAKKYLSGIHGKNYLNEKIFSDANIEVIYENFAHPTYHQIHGNFIPNMSIIDLLFNEGDNSKRILNECKNI